MKSRILIALSLLTIALISQSASAGVASTGVREVEEFAARKLTAKVGENAIDDTAEQTARAVAKYGEEARPLVKATGEAGVRALEQAGPKAPDVIKLFARKGDEAVWVVSENKRLALFLKHGDSAADALIKHPGIADSLVSRFGTDAAIALKSVSRQNAQRLAILEKEGVLSASPHSKELLSVVGKYGDAAMEFIWKNKGALAVAGVLVTFLNDPLPYIQGIKELVIDPIAKPIVESVNWTLLLSLALVVIFLPFITRSVLRARQVTNN